MVDRDEKRYKGVLRRVLRDGFNIGNVPKNQSSEQFFIDCMLDECDFTATFGAFGSPYKSFVKESEKLSELLKCDFTKEQIDAIHWATGVLPSSMLYFEKSKKLNKSIGDMIVDSLRREVGYIDYYEDKKYSFLSEISNYSKEQILVKIKKFSKDILFIDSEVNVVIGENSDFYAGGGNFSFRNITDKSVSFGFNTYMEKTDTIEIFTTKDGYFKVVRTFNFRPHDSYGRQISNNTETLYEKNVTRKDLRKILLEQRLEQLKLA